MRRSDLIYRRMGTSSYVFSTATNYATHALLNLAASPYLLAVYAASIWSGANYGARQQTSTFVQRGAPGSALGTVIPLVTGEAMPPAAHYYDDAATITTPSWIWLGVSDYGPMSYVAPAAVLQPGWSYVMQTPQQTGLQGIGFFLFSWLDIEQLDQGPKFGIEELAALLSQSTGG